MTLQVAIEAILLALFELAELALNGSVMELEAKDTWNKLGWLLNGTAVRVGEEKHVWECGAEEGAINMLVARARGIDLAASRAEDLDACLVWQVRETNRQHAVTFARRTWASAETAFKILLKLENIAILIKHQSEQEDARITIKTDLRNQLTTRGCNCWMNARNTRENPPCTPARAR